MQQQQPGQRQQSVRNSRSSAPYIPTDRQFQGFIQGLRSCSVSPDRVSVHPPACSFSSTSSCPCVRIWEGQTDHFLFSGPGNFIQFPLFLISADSLGDYHHIQRLLSTAAVMAKSPEVKLAVFGRAGVGKSALVVRFLTRRFIWEYDPTLESTYRHQANIDDEVVTMEILDTAGQEDIQQKEGHVRWGDGFVIVYDITDRGSFEEVGPLRSLLEEVKKPKNVPLVLVGNKSDLDHIRQVATEEGERLAAEMACAFYECSACANEGGAVAEAFHELCREVRRRKAVQGKARRRSSTTHVKQAINKMLTKISS